MTIQLQNGDRVVHEIDGDIGHVESIVDIESGYIDVRWLTPHNVPSCVVSCCPIAILARVGTNVVPRPRSREWWIEANEFNAMIQSILMNELE